jgi:hypothetical protein
MTGRSSDAAILSQLIGLHYYHEPIILDTTFGGGRMWRGCPYQPTTRFDRRPLTGVDVVGEWADLPRLFGAAAFQLIVWDPPHQTDGGARAWGKGLWSDAYGTGATDLRGHMNISHLYPGFLEAARGVLVPNGMLLAKIADQVHGSEQQLQAVDLVIAARTAGWTVCEMVPKMRQPTANDPRWRRQLHMRKAWSYWICAHPGSRCTAIGVALVRQCEGCGRDFHAKRRHARTCSDACRQRLRYRKNLTVSRSGTQVESVRKKAWG